MDSSPPAKGIFAEAGGLFQASPAAMVSVLMGVVSYPQQID
jgi:hypothetical protein